MMEFGQMERKRDGVPEGQESTRKAGSGKD
jgi:hypothetical protein